ncbi:hypothetical protein [Calothrix sp. 336/3]|uniref:hypothetical protein n=1 Tax=Calothrix sp. 336/3 TaxID=1337936 RepID=UPI0004E42ABB|nr:hypothetical protein [Calothrix sp. 336/3]AKG22146.1 hypothetical protein IJ00_13525 [Calothrix sp. 336/3]
MGSCQLPVSAQSTASACQATVYDMSFVNWQTPVFKPDSTEASSNYIEGSQQDLSTTALTLLSSFTTAPIIWRMRVQANDVLAAKSNAPTYTVLSTTDTGNPFKKAKANPHTGISEFTTCSDGTVVLEGKFTLTFTNLSLSEVTAKTHPGGVKICVATQSTNCSSP